MKRVLTVIAGVAALGAAYSALRAQETGSRSVWDGVYTEQQARRGQEQYTTHCLDCHGEDLEGDQETPPLRGGRFFANWEGQNLGGVYLRIRRDMPMNWEVGTMSSSVTADLVAYILSINGFPPGKSELPHARQDLDQIRMESAKPKR